MSNLASDDSVAIDTPALDEPAKESAAAFREALIEQIPYLRAFARSLCRDRHAADDLAQETLMRAWQARASFKVGTNMRAWLFTILRNFYYSDCRRARRRLPWTDEMSERLLVGGAEQPASLELAELGRAISMLPDAQRDALILVGAGGIRYEEAARICGCAVGTIKSRVARARTALLAILDGEGPPPARDSRGGEGAARDITETLGALTANGTPQP